MKQKKYLMFLIPLVAVVVIVESVVLVSGLRNKTKDESGVEPQVVVPTEEPAVLDLVFSGEKRMSLGQSYKLGLTVVPKSNFQVDSIDAFVKYDKSAFDLTALTAGVGLPKPFFSRISDKTSQVVMSYKVVEDGGYQLKANFPVSVFEVMVTPKKAGEYVFEVNRGEVSGESKTMFVASETAAVLPYSANSLVVKVEN